MIFDSSTKTIFLEVPKTGSSSMAESLTSASTNIHRNVFINNSFHFDCETHISYKQLEHVLSGNVYDHRIVAFVRDPYSLVISKYEYYRSGRGAEWAKDPESSLGLKLRCCYARVPFSLWLATYPFKDNSFFLINKKNKLPKNLELYDYRMLDSVLNKYAKENGLVIKLKRVNATEYSRKLTYLQRKLVKFRFAKDFKLFGKIFL